MMSRDISKILCRDRLSRRYFYILLLHVMMWC